MFEQQQQDKQELTHRSVRSFVSRNRRMRKSDQQAYDTLWPKWGLSVEEGKLDPQQVFKRQAPLVLEIGFGMGDSLLEDAKKFPEYDYIGVEVHVPGVARLLRYMEIYDVKNIRIYQVNVLDVLERCIADLSLERIQIYFPDPWPKKRHHKRRLIQPPFIQLVQQKIKPGGILHVATDSESYASHITTVLSENRELENLAGAGQFHKEQNLRPETKYERRGKKLGHPVWDFVFQKQKRMDAHEGKEKDS